MRNIALIILALCVVSCGVKRGLKSPAQIQHEQAKKADKAAAKQ